MNDSMSLPPLPNMTFQGDMSGAGMLDLPNLKIDGDMSQAGKIEVPDLKLDSDMTKVGNLEHSTGLDKKVDEQMGKLTDTLSDNIGGYAASLVRTVVGLV